MTEHTRFAKPRDAISRVQQQKRNKFRNSRVLSCINHPVSVKVVFRTLFYFRSGNVTFVPNLSVKVAYDSIPSSTDSQAPIKILTIAKIGCIQHSDVFDYFSFDQKARA